MMVNAVAFYSAGVELNVRLFFFGFVWLTDAFPAYQVLALVFIRKLLDFIFTKRELSWLDDLMPEWKKKKLEDAQQEVQSSSSA